jgi:GTP cyclohydrolase I
MDKQLRQFIKERYIKRFKASTFNKALKEYLEIKDFAPSGNINDTQSITDEAHFCMRISAQYHLTEAFKAMKIDLSDPNIAEDDSGNIGTPGRIAKVWCGFDTHDTMEALSGRWGEKPRMASFPNTGKTDPVFVTSRLDAMCSHHFIRFGDDQMDENSIVVVGYIPEDKLGGISKINRFIEWCSKRGWLQEDLTEYIGKEVEQAFETKSVYVALLNNKHGCASTRGVMDREAATTTTYSSGKFKDEPDLIPARFRG